MIHTQQGQIVHVIRTLIHTDYVRKKIITHTDYNNYTSCGDFNEEDDFNSLNSGCV